VAAVLVIRLFRMTASGQKRKSKTAFLMSVKRPKAEVSRRQSDVRYVPNPDIGGV